MISFEWTTRQTHMNCQVITGTATSDSLPCQPSLRDTCLRCQWMCRVSPQHCTRHTGADRMAQLSAGNVEVLLSAQCISSIGQIIKSVCVSVSQSVSHSVSEWVCHTKRVERSTDRNLPPIFTKLATKVETQEMWLPIVFGGNPKYLYPPNRKWN